MAKKSVVPTFNYPPTEKERGGNKVGWRVYPTRELAEEAAKVAKQEAEYKAGLGFDFGYQSPGSIREVNGEFEVVVP